MTIIEFLRCWPSLGNMALTSLLKEIRLLWEITLEKIVVLKLNEAQTHTQKTQAAPRTFLRHARKKMAVSWKRKN